MQRISLSNAAFEGDNNAYLFASGPETVLVDTGDWTDATREQLEAGLATHGVAIADIDRVLLTHWHADHTGLAGDIEAESGATVHVHVADAPLVAGHDDAWNRLQEMHERYFAEWGMPAAKQAVLRDRLFDPALAENPPDVTTFRDGAQFEVNGHRLEAVHASGHAAGLCLFELDGREVLSGDALLPKYTPNVGGADVRVENALATYLETLRAIVATEYDRAWPGHRAPIEDPAARARHIIDHHEERAWRTLDALDRFGPADPWTISADLFGELHGIHILHGPGEVYAHLDHLERAGLVVAEGTDYRLADGVAAQLGERTDQRWPLRD